LGLHAPGEIVPAGAAALAGLPESRAEAALESLAAAHLLRQRRPRRYELHPVIRWYARGQVTAVHVGRSVDHARRLTGA
jgi:hypothetical protein